MSDTVFVNGVTLTDAEWFQDVNDPVYSQVANVMNSAYGAVGDGSTDDTIAVAAALASTLDVYVPPDFTFLVTGLTASTANQRIYGHGIIKLKDASNQALVRVTASGIVIDGVRFDGNKANQTTVDDILGSVIYLPTGVNNVEVMNCVIANAKRNGIAGFGDHTGCKYVGNRIDSPGFIGIYPSSGSGHPFSYGEISGNYITSPGQDGIGTVGMQHCSITGNRIFEPVVAGISLEASCKWTSVTGNTILGNAAAGPTGTNTGIQVNDSSNITITGNTVKKCGNGIGISGGVTSQNVAVIGNTIDDCGYSSASIALDTSVSVSYLSAYKYGITCVGNTILNSRLAGIFINGIQGAVACNNYINGFNLDLVSTVNRQMGAIVLRNFSHNNTINGNTITDSTGGNLKAGILEVQDGSASPAKNTYRDNQISGLNQDICITFSGTDQSLVVRPAMSTSAPTANTWARGQIQYHAFPASGGSIGWVSTDSRAGSFSTYSSTGTINSGTAALTLASTDGLFEGMSITIAGAGPASAALNTVISALNRSTKVATLQDNASTSVVAAAVTPYNPTFKTWGVIA